ncbi:uncharacterized protein LOC111626877 [Centruroides sculpturatus]|uniref:uncharacterized protein LOC111626877 n=1 Tax=Centruroides sculpturatus TaxID=218467 RepID=UPI000C6E5B3A|nr:uncharacterized protein LOC111626877 [Centruroides sculpturatus]
MKVQLICVLLISTLFVQYVECGKKLKLKKIAKYAAPLLLAGIAKKPTIIPIPFIVPILKHITTSHHHVPVVKHDIGYHHIKVLHGGFHDDLYGGGLHDGIYGGFHGGWNEGWW